MEQKRFNHLFKNWTSRSVFMENDMLPEEKCRFNISFSYTGDANVVLNWINADDSLKHSISFCNEQTTTSKILGMVSGNIQLKDNDEIEARYINTEKFKLILFGEDNLLMIDKEKDVYVDFVSSQS